MDAGPSSRLSEKRWSARKETAPTSLIPLEAFWTVMPLDDVGEMKQPKQSKD
jgi:hypothetical protein